MSAGGLLIVRVGAMGDVLHALPAVTAWKLRHPERELGWAIEPRWRALLQDDDGRGPVVDRVHAVPTREWKARPISRATLASLGALRSSLLAEHYEAVVDLQGSIRSAVIGRLAGTGALAGSTRPRERPARFLYQRTFRTRSPHVVEQAAELLGAAMGEELKPARVELPMDAGAAASVAGKLGSLTGGRLALLVPQAGWGAKQWPAERFGAVAAGLAVQGITPLVNAVGGDDALAGSVVAGSHGCAVAVTLSLPELIALTRVVSVVVAGDTGPLHLAAALGRPVVALFGPTDPARTGPWATRSRVHRYGASVTDHRRHAAVEEGLLQVTTEAVLASAIAMCSDEGMGSTT